MWQTPPLHRYRLVCTPCRKRKNLHRYCRRYTLLCRATCPLPSTVHCQLRLPTNTPAKGGAKGGARGVGCTATETRFQFHNLVFLSTCFGSDLGNSLTRAQQTVPHLEAITTPLVHWYALTPLIYTRWTFTINAPAPSDVKRACEHHFVVYPRSISTMLSAVSHKILGSQKSISNAIHKFPNCFNWSPPLLNFEMYDYKWTKEQ